MGKVGHPTVQAPVDDGDDVAKHIDKDDEGGEGVHVQVYNERVQVDVPVQNPVNREGGAVQNQVVGEWMWPRLMRRDLWMILRFHSRSYSLWRP